MHVATIILVVAAVLRIGLVLLRRGRRS